jgi:3-methyl-2-oxobutanoate hydroxymethyltransferase
VRALTEAEIPVVGHLGLTPQSVHRMGGYRVQARTAETARNCSRTTRWRWPKPAPEPWCWKACRARWPREITAELPIPTIGIGAGPECDGQILVFHDLLNLTFAPPPSSCAAMPTPARSSREAIEHYREDVEHRAFPSDEESYHLPSAARRHRQLGWPSRHRRPGAHHGCAA